MIVVAGLPGSGNRLVRSLLQAAGAEVVIFHGRSGDLPQGALPAAVVLTARNPWIRAQSMHTRGDAPSWDFSRDEHYLRNILAFVVVHGLPVRIIPYEAIIQDPGGVRCDLLGWLSLPTNTPWPSTITDGNAKHLAAHAG